MTTYCDDDLLLLSGIQHFAFCERQWALIHIERQWAESQRTMEGHHLHERVHDPTLIDTAEDRVLTRAVPVLSHRLGLYGVLDALELRQVGPNAGGIALPGRDGHWLPQPVEYKRGRPKADDRDEVQLCAQAICLEEMLGVHIEAGDLFYGQTRHRCHVLFSPALRDRVEQLCQRMHTLYEQGTTPPASRGKNCNLCSLVDACLPGLTRSARPVSEYIQKYISADDSL